MSLRDTMCAVCLHLPDRTDRLPIIAHQERVLGVPVNIVEGVHTLPVNHSLPEVAASGLMGGVMVYGMQALLQAGLASGKDWILCLEDDGVLTDDAIQRLEEVVTAVPTADIVYGGWYPHHGHNDRTVESYAESPFFELVGGPVTDADCMLIKREFASELYDATAQASFYTAPQSDVCLNDWINKHNKKRLLDSPSRRFRQQVTSEVDRPLLWLEDDIDVPYNFREIWTHYERTLPEDWQIAVLGWGIISDDQDIKIRSVTSGWWHLEGGTKMWAQFDGSQAVLVNRGEWRLKLKNKEFRCDSMLCAALKSIGITQIYHTDTILIGTNDPQDSVGNCRIMKPKMTTPLYYSPKRYTRNVKESDFIGAIIPINTFTYLPDRLRIYGDDIGREIKLD